MKHFFKNALAITLGIVLLVWLVVPVLHIYMLNSESQAEDQIPYTLATWWALVSG